MEGDFDTRRDQFRESGTDYEDRPEGDHLTEDRAQEDDWVRSGNVGGRGPGDTADIVDGLRHSGLEKQEEHL